MGYRFPLLREMIIVTLYRICFLLFLTMSLIALLYIIYWVYDSGSYNTITDSQYALIPAIFVFSFGLTLFLPGNYNKTAKIVLKQLENFQLNTPQSTILNRSPKKRTSSKYTSHK